MKRVTVRLSHGRVATLEYLTSQGLYGDASAVIRDGVRRLAMAHGRQAGLPSLDSPDRGGAQRQTVRFPEGLLTELDDLVEAGVVGSRSDAIRLAIETVASAVEGATAGLGMTERDRIQRLQRQGHYESGGAVVRAALKSLERAHQRGFEPASGVAE
jgi:Arc/MetJ-type ribon-helix-helix transcriptional regulator